MRRLRAFWMSLIVLLGSWEGYVRLSGISPFFLVPPSTVASRLGEWLVTGRLFVDLGASILLILLGLGLAAAFILLFVHSLSYSGFFQDPITWGALAVAAAVLVPARRPSESAATLPEPSAPAALVPGATRAAPPVRGRWQT